MKHWKRIDYDYDYEFDEKLANLPELLSKKYKHKHLANNFHRKKTTYLNLQNALQCWPPNSMMKMFRS